MVLLRLRHYSLLTLNYPLSTIHYQLPKLSIQKLAIDFFLTLVILIFVGDNLRLGRVYGSRVGYKRGIC
jgi:hypothetical protein